MGVLTDVSNWARYPKSRSLVVPVDSGTEPLPPVPQEFLLLPFGMGRSLGDSCLNDGNALLHTRGMNRILKLDAGTGLLEVEAGVSFDQILRLAVPLGWFLPVTPGTRFVSVGGALANDVHGKNHHVAGTFGLHVKGFELRRSDGSVRWCSPEENRDWFRATLGGLGLTGLVTRVQLQLKAVVNSWLDTETMRFGGLDEFHALTEESQTKFEYIVAWADTLSRRGLGSGVFIRGNHSQDRGRREREVPGRALVAAPNLPFRLLNPVTIRAFNAGFYWGRRARSKSVSGIGPFFYPLDGVDAYHRIYGPQGMIQWQALIPSREAVEEVLRRARQMGGSFLTVMKVMGGAERPGMMSFSGAGVTLALDYPFSEALLPRLEALDAIVVAAGGRLYPAKDARMSGAVFRASYPQWEDFQRYIDPRFSSSFWRRVTGHQ